MGLDEMPIGCMTVYQNVLDGKIVLEKGTVGIIIFGVIVLTWVLFWIGRWSQTDYEGGFIMIGEELIKRIDEHLTRSWEPETERLFEDIKASLERLLASLRLSQKGSAESYEKEIADLKQRIAELEQTQRNWGKTDNARLEARIAEMGLSMEAWRDRAIDRQKIIDLAAEREIKAEKRIAELESQIVAQRVAITNIKQVTDELDELLEQYKEKYGEINDDR